MTRKEERKPGEPLKNINHELFCNYYATSRDHFGNGVSSYMEVYGTDKENPSSYSGAKSNAHKLLTNTDILARIRELLDNRILNDEFVDRELSFIIEQNSDMSTKMRGIAEYNKMKSRIQDKIDITSKGKSIAPEKAELIKQLLNNS